MTSILGPYLSYHHWWQSTEDYLRQLDPAWARIHQPTAKGIFVTQKNAPNANIMQRSWDIDDHNGDRKREMYADPKGAARLHLQMWKQKWEDLESELKRNGWAYNTNRWYLGLVNEPDPAYAPQVVEYSLEAMRLIEYRDIRLGLVCSSVGNFSKPSENDRGWSLFKPLEQPINDGGHILIVHEYWQPEGPSFGEDAGNLAWRHKHIPLNVPILIGESGANGYIYGRHSQTDDAGWGKFMDAAKFAAQTKEYIAGCDERVKGVLLYMEDYHSDQWRTFDTSGAHNELLAIKDVRPGKPTPFAGSTTTRLPSISTPPTQPPQGSLTPAPVEVVPLSAGIVVSVVAANVRKNASISAPVLFVAERGTEFLTTGETPEWYEVNHGGPAYIHKSVAKLLAGNKPQRPSPGGSQPSNEQEAWARSLAFTAKWEGKYQNVHNDSGNWTGGAVGVGVNKGTNWGVSAASYPHLDIKNLSREQAHEIFRRDYWIPSGASKLPWPACLIVFDAAILHGVGTAQAWQKEVGTSAFAFAAKRLRSYTKMNNWDTWGRAWCLRVADLLEEASKS